MLPRHAISTILAALGAAIPVAAQWTETGPASVPSARYFSAMTYDAQRNVTVLFGGGVGASLSNETWTYDGATWTRKNTPFAPSRRAAAEMVFDTSRGVGVLYGGNINATFGGNADDTTWEWNGTTWTRKFPFATAGRRTAFAMAYDAGRNRVVLYGGLTNPNSPIASSETFEYDGTNWTRVTPATNPGPRERAAMCYHAGLGVVVLFGGLDPQIQAYADTWTFDGSNWTQVNISGPSPAPRTTARMVYDPARGVCVLHGGHGSFGNPTWDTWEFDGTSWTQTSSGIPTNRFYQSMAMDTARRRPVMFGGADSVFSLGPVNETWEYGADYRSFGAGCLGSNGVPALSGAGVPRLGSSFTANVTNLEPNATSALMALGLSNEVAPFGPLPLNLTFAGLTGCNLYVSMEAAFPFQAAGGSGSWTLNIPTNPALFGARLFLQAFSLDPGHNPASLVLSNAGSVLIGV